MIIDIEIKIADSHGNILQHLSKRFDDIDSSEDRLNFSLDIGKSFEQFLSEYMSYSGRRIQEKLFTGSKPPLTGNPYESWNNLSSGGFLQSAKSLPSVKELPSQDRENILQTDSCTNKKLEDQEIEYLIRIGNNNIFSGKFPVQQLIPTGGTIQEIQNAKLPNNHETGCDDLNYLMQKAIEKYETTFYHIAKNQEEEISEQQQENGTKVSACTLACD